MARTRKQYGGLDERARRQGVARQFELQLPRYPHLKLLRRLTNYRYVLFDAEGKQEVRATVLETSFDFFEYRLNLAAHDYQLVIVQRHNAVLPLWCLELDTACLYRPGAIPPIERPVRKHRNREEAQLFVSMLIVGVETAYEQLAAMSGRTRRRYLAERARYLRPKVGRPLAV